MSENGIMQAEQRVREMNMMARQYTEQGNRFMRQNNQGAAPRVQQQTRFEPVDRDGQRGTYGNSAQPRNENRGNVPRGQSSVPEQKRFPEQSRPEPPQRENTAVQKNPMSAPTDITSLFTGFGMDGEKLMIMLIMYILIKEKADLKLILALGYLIL